MDRFSSMLVRLGMLVFLILGLAAMLLLGLGLHDPAGLLRIFARFTGALFALAAAWLGALLLLFRFLPRAEKKKRNK